MLLLFSLSIGAVAVEVVLLVSLHFPKHEPRLFLVNPGNDIKGGKNNIYSL